MRISAGSVFHREGGKWGFSFDNYGGDDWRGLFPGNFGACSHNDIRFDKCVNLLIPIKKKVAEDHLGVAP